MLKPKLITAVFAGLSAGLAAAPALAHPGHIAGLGGHDHWVAGIAIGAAVGVSLWGVLKERRKKAGKKAAGRARARKGKQKPQEA